MVNSCTQGEGKGQRMGSKGGGPWQLSQPGPGCTQLSGQSRRSAPTGSVGAQEQAPCGCGCAVQ